MTRRAIKLKISDGTGDDDDVSVVNAVPVAIAARATVGDDIMAARPGARPSDGDGEFVCVREFGREGSSVLLSRVRGSRVGFAGKSIVRSGGEVRSRRFLNHGVKDGHVTWTCDGLLCGRTYARLNMARVRGNPKLPQRGKMLFVRKDSPH